MRYSLGMIEVVSIPAGMEAADAMMKASAVELAYAQPVCAGKYIAVVTGDVAAVQASVKAGSKTAGPKLIDSMVIAGVHEQVPKALNACSEIGQIQAVGAMETFSLCAAVLTADAAVKAADVDLIEIRLGRGLGGKSFITMTGGVAAVKAAIKAGTAIPQAQGLISGSVVIASPHPEIVRTFI